MQTFTSSATSINRSKLPKVYSKATLSAPLVLDYGCGKYTDHISDHVNGLCRTYLPYDPFNQPKAVNIHSMELVRMAIDHGEAVDVVCSNVLNVIDSDSVVSMICHQIETIVTATGGAGFVTVYEGDHSGIGRQTGKDQYQRNAPLRYYLRFFHNATIHNGMIVVGQ